MLAVNNLSARFGERFLFKNVSLQFLEGSRYGLIGANGSGKTTFLKILAKEHTADSGEILLANRSKIGTLKQDHFLYEKVSLLDTVLMGRKELWDATNKKNELLAKEPFDESDNDLLAKLEDVVALYGGYTAESDAAKLLEGLGLPGNLHQNTMQTLSGGYKLRVLLAQVLFAQPEILLLDEPTNHLDIFSIKWLEGYLQSFPGILVVTSHDRDFLSTVCTHMVDVDCGTIKIYKGSYEHFLQRKEEDRLQKSLEIEAIQRKQSDLQGFVDRFGAKASKATQAQSRVKMIEKLGESIEELIPTSRAYPNINFEITRQSAHTPLIVSNLGKSYGAKQVLKDVSFEVNRQDRLAILGPNGIGKSTLLEIITGSTKQDDGSFNWGFESHYTYFPQEPPKDMKPDMTPIDWLSQYDRNATTESLRGLLARVLFKKDDATTKRIGILSGGEKSRLVLARMMLQKHNVLILDEPTNHLDMEAIDVLTQSLLDYKGTIIFVSHNCFFVSKVATRIIEISSSGLTDFRGSYDEYVAETQRDYLSSNVALRLRFSKQFYHSSEEAPQPKKVESSNYDTRKKQQSQKRALESNVKKLEEACHKIEQEIHRVDHILAAENFYQKASQSEVQKILKEKDTLDQKLMDAMLAWENASLELQDLT